MDHMADSYAIDDLLRLCLRRLSLQDFSTAQNFARLAQRNFPNRPEFSQISTIAAVHLAADHHLPGEQVDYFSVLQLDKTSSSLDIRTVRTKFKNLLLLLHPSKNKYPFASEAVKIVCDAWAVLSDPNKRTQFGNVGENHDCSVKETFWTVCPYCYFLFEYEGMYKNCCLRCQNCSRAFQGVAVPTPEKGMIVEGKEEYYCGFGRFPVKYYVGCLDEKKANRENDGFSEVNGNVKTEESERVGAEEKVESNLNNVETDKVMQGSAQVRSSGKRFKSTAWNAKKIMGRGKKVKLDMNTDFGDSCGNFEEENGSKDLDFSVDDIEIIVGEDDIYISLKKQG